MLIIVFNVQATVATFVIYNHNTFIVRATKEREKKNMKAVNISKMT
jgi:hypothetical protein